ncbi:hypothetical protein BDZ91DRAFT_752595 [Kalaharituber pfeilii]|nr:hypothetical protein BDZ91DRAFT_752595 [Kalaharituber pfeilii]
MTRAESRRVQFFPALFPGRLTRSPTPERCHSLSDGSPQLFVLNREVNANLESVLYLLQHTQPCNLLGPSTLLTIASYRLASVGATNKATLLRSNFLPVRFAMAWPRSRIVAMIFIGDQYSSRQKAMGSRLLSTTRLPLRCVIEPARLQGKYTKP